MHTHVTVMHTHVTVTPSQPFQEEEKTFRNIDLLGAQYSTSPFQTRAVPAVAGLRELRHHV
eukprot:1003879-Rhodomonas_salina.2